MRNKILVAILIALVTFGFFKVEARAAIAFLYDKSSPNNMLTLKKPKQIFIGQKKLNIDYSIGGRNRGISGTFKSSNKNVAKVSKSGLVTPLKPGKVIISFRYKVNGKLKRIKCRLAVCNRVDSLEIEAKGTFTGSMPVDSILQFKATAKSGGNTIKLSPGKKKNYGIYYSLFLDPECKNPAPSDFATITSSGYFASGSNPGRVYVRAVAQSGKYAVDGVYSNIIKIDMISRIEYSQTGPDTFRVRCQSGDINSISLTNSMGELVSTSFTLTPDKKEANVKVNGNLEGVFKLSVKIGNVTQDISAGFENTFVKDIVLESNNIPISSLGGSGLTAEVRYKLLDQFGNDVTKDFRFSKKSYALWESNTKVSLKEDGVFSIPLTISQTVGYKGNLEIVYGGQNSISKKFEVTIGNPIYIKSLEIMGIYKRTNNTYVKVMDKTRNMPSGSLISAFGGVVNLNTVPESYYILIRAKDNYGNSITSAGVDQTKILLTITTNTGIAQDTADGKLQSISPITIDNETFLTYPLKPGIVREGTVNIHAVASGNTANSFMEGRVTSSTSGGTLVIAGEGRVGVENLITFILYNSSNMQIKKYEDVIATLGLNDSGAGQVLLMPGSNIISASSGSYFIIRRNNSTGFADLYYIPTVTALGGYGMTKNGEEITVFKGTAMEKKFVLTVKLQ